MADTAAAEVNTAEGFEAQQKMMFSPFGSSFDSGYMSRLYEVLMASIGKTGSFTNFQLNISIMNQIVQNHYYSDICIRDFSVQFAAQRTNLFEPIFLNSFNKTGV